ncbi:hypothetical protein I4641_03795 [Waterburya agarophytonicola K14]|uniref:Type II secretion system protein GspE N-terminal domain-containing protein n=1 Tax=Waterburya agarophytonicola KI4 TaxID=2874699 RepID=A0A964BPS9_9CYAN|nr:hypothetical protein [Waterburya agarophytonicola]MCC0176102.1 hypothetical protein [Waterburya agarophytonicola KI4]
MSQFNNSSHYSDDIPAAMFADCLANSKEILELIDAVFPVDSCRHYQVLPLNLESNNLVLGMLDPSNEESLKFVNSIAKVFKYNLQLRLIDAQTLQIILASYPQHSNQPVRQNGNGDRQKTVIDATVIDQAFDPSKHSAINNASSRKLADSAPTVISPSDEQLSSTENNSFQGLEDLPPDLDFLRDLDLSPSEKSKPSRPEVDKTATLYEIPPEFLNQQQSNNLDTKQTIIAENTTELLASKISQSESEIALAQAQISDLIAEVSPQIVEKEELQSVDFLDELKSNLSWQKLLEQAFEYHTEEINLTRHSSYGSVVAQQKNSPQSSLKQVPLPIFCSLIDEIKRMAKIPLDMSNHPKKVVLERFYQQERILLRLAFSVENQKEIVTVQIFRGKNLAVYEQQQMDKVSEQALYLAKQLEKTLRRIQACFDLAEFTNLRELQIIQSRINHQLRLLDK